MKANESTTDRVIRIVLGLILIYLYFSNTVTGTLGIILVILGVVAAITGITGFCGIYKLLGISTKK